MTAPAQDLQTLLVAYATAAGTAAGSARPTAELSATTSAADVVFNQLGADLPPLYWTVQTASRTGLSSQPTEIRGQVEPGTDDTEAGQTLVAWAERLQLPYADHSLPGTLTYFDLRDSCYLVVWGVVDQQRWTATACEPVRRALAGEQITDEPRTGDLMEDSFEGWPV